MLSIYEKSKLYSHPKKEIKALKHANVIEAKLLVLIKSSVDLEPELIEMLDKIVGALNIDFSDTEYIVFKDKVFLSQIANEYQSENVLVFGAECKDLNLNMDLAQFKVYTINNRKVLLSKNIIDVYGNQKLKGMLWNQLKPMI